MRRLFIIFLVHSFLQDHQFKENEDFSELQNIQSSLIQKNINKISEFRDSLHLYSKNESCYF